jgi:hypothetical protein
MHCHMNVKLLVYVNPKARLGTVSVTVTITFCAFGII